MYFNAVILCFVLVSCFTTKVYGDKQNVTDQPITGFEYQILAAKLDEQQRRLIEMDFAMKATNKKLFQAINQLSETIAQNLNVAQHTTSNQTDSAICEQMRKEIKMIASKTDLERYTIDPEWSYYCNISITSCKEEPSKQPGKYIIQPTVYSLPTYYNTPFLGYCEPTAYGGGWLVIQYRYDGSLSFNRSWTEYRNGFGSMEEEFWLGLEQMHRLTSAGPYELLVELKDFDGNYKYARYSEFMIGSEMEEYALKKLGTYTGTAGDSLKIHKSMKFTTKDRDNDVWSRGNCASHLKGAWWCSDDNHSNLNGVYKKGERLFAIFWWDFKLDHIGLAYSRMMIRNVFGFEQNVTASSFSGFAYEMIENKLEYLQHKLIEMDIAIREVDMKLSDTMHNMSRILSEGLLTAINQQSQTVVNNLTAMQHHLNRTEQTANAKHEQMWKDIQMLPSKKDLAWFKIDSGLYLRNFSLRSCKEVSSKQSGKYIIQPTVYDAPFLAYCEQTTFGGAWLVVQYRYDGSLNFYRTWTEYKSGFGSIDAEFWLGLEHLHRLTSARPHELLVELKDFDGNYVYARYDGFEIGSETEQYSFKKLGTYTGTAGDALDYQRGMKFTTKDRHHDIHPFLNCASHHEGAWWYKDCAKSNLNGAYMKGEIPKAMFWLRYRSSGLAYSRMLIRES
uniref:Fibrinogen C-terminal domain-containing protein n=1 Tax=Anopheles christyi TaxID=43041 RepID=A0A182JRV8_9DIPT